MGELFSTLISEGEERSLLVQTLSSGPLVEDLIFCLIYYVVLNGGKEKLNFFQYSLRICEDKKIPYNPLLSEIN